MQHTKQFVVTADTALGMQGAARTQKGGVHSAFPGLLQRLQSVPPPSQLVITSMHCLHYQLIRALYSHTTPKGPLTYLKLET